MYSTFYRRSRQAGFTLIEMLVVIAIIGLIISILFPGLQSVQEKAKSTVCMNQLRELGRALKTMEGDSGITVPTFVDGTNLRFYPGKGLYKWMQWLVEGEYVEDSDLFYCPSRPKSDFQNFTEVGKVAYNTECSYGHNEIIGRMGRGGAALKFFQIIPAAQIPLFADSLFYRLINPDDWQWWYQMDPRHRGRGNVIYADGHVASKTWDEFYDNWYEAHSKLP
jgi:prepilin-type N-terminal cleavage/methylation domain-containing protein/prepilin-type processing-associated H-X9-DG protein